MRITTERLVPIRFAGKSEEDRPITLVLNALDNAGELEPERKTP